MRTLPRLVIGLVIGLLVATTAVAVVLWVGERGDGEPARRDRRATSAPASRPTTTPLPTTTTTLPPGLALPLVPRPVRVAWAGDSVAASLYPAMANAAAGRGIELVDRTTPGCGMVRGAPADDALVPIDFVSACDQAIPSHNLGTGASGADVVTWLSTWETANRFVDGQAFVFGTPEADEVLLRLIDESAQQLLSGGARLVLVTMPPNTTGPRRPVVSDQDVQRALHLDDLLRRYATAHADRVALLDLAAIVCPTGPPCPTEVEGVTLRPDDGGHFAGDGPAWVAPRVLDRLLGVG